jgi:hypothetical protein
MRVLDQGIRFKADIGLFCWALAALSVSFFPLVAVAYEPAQLDPVILRTIAAVDADQLNVLKTELDRECLSTLNSRANLNLPRLLTLSACREFARYFGAVTSLTPPQKQTLDWLAAQPRLMPTLTSAVCSKDPPDRLIKVLDLLRSRQPDRLEEYPDLASAVAVVWDKPTARDPTRHEFKFDVDRPAALFDYFTDPRNQMRFDLKTLAWQLDVYVVDLKISTDEIRWAVNRYGNNYSIADLFFEVVYDDNAYLNGDDKKIASHPYTLQNILQYGGVCVEQAYFADQVAKTLGIPACICESHGGGSGAVAHAWLGLLTLQNRKAAWDFQDGRYPEDLYWSADILDPQTHETLTDADVGLLAELENVTPEARQTSALELKLSDLLPLSQRADFYLREIRICPGNGSAWTAVADLGANRQLTPAQSEAFGRDVDQILIQSYPDFAWQILVHFVSRLPMQEQIARLDSIAQEFPQRPDLRARIRLLQADMLLARSQNDLAMRELGDVLVNEINAGPIVLSAMHRVDKLMRAQNNLLRLVNIYAEVWPKIPAPDRSAYVYWTPYYEVGKTYLTLLQSMGRGGDADVVRRKLVEVIPPGAELK